MSDDLELRIARLSLKPGDVLVLKTERVLSAATHERIKNDLVRILGDDMRCMILENGFSLETIELRSWIKCSERMPEAQKIVLVYDAGENEFSVAAWCPEGNAQWSAVCGMGGFECEFRLTPTHWMELPDVPT